MSWLFAGHRNQQFGTLLTIMSMVFGLGSIVYWIAGRAGPLPMAVVFGLALFSLLRLARAGAFVDERGVRVVNPFSTRRVAWEDVAGFSLRRHGGFPAVGFVDRVDGGRLMVWGIQARSSTPAARRPAETAVAELQERFEAERARRTG